MSLDTEIFRGNQVPVRTEEEEGKGNGLEVRVFYGKSGNVIGPEAVANHVPITMLDVIMNKEGARFAQEIPPGQEGFVLALWTR